MLPLETWDQLEPKPERFQSLTVTHWPSYSTWFPVLIILMRSLHGSVSVSWHSVCQVSFEAVMSLFIRSIFFLSFAVQVFICSVEIDQEGIPVFYTSSTQNWNLELNIPHLISAALFTTCGFYQMAVWALGKHRNYRKEFKDYPRSRKSIVPFLLWFYFEWFRRRKYPCIFAFFV